MLSNPQGINNQKPWVTPPTYLPIQQQLRNFRNTNSNFDEFACDFQNLMEAWNRMASHLRSGLFTGISSIPLQIGRNGFQTRVDVRQFLPNEINLQIQNGQVIVKGNHVENQIGPNRHAYASHSFIRRFKLPSGYNPNNVLTSLTPDGFLTLNIPPQFIQGNAMAKVMGGGQQIAQLRKYY